MRCLLKIPRARRCGLGPLDQAQRGGDVLDLARELNFPVPMAALAHQPFLMAAASVERHLRVDQNRGRNQLNLFKKGPFVSNSMKRFALSQKAGDFQG